MYAFAKISLPVVGLCLLLGSACASSTGANPSAATTPPATGRTVPSAPRVADPEPSRAADLASAKRAVMTTAVLGKPWVQPAKVNTSGGKATEACPGEPALVTLAPARASAVATFTRGAARGASIARFTVETVSDQGRRYREAWTRTARSCAQFKDATGLYVVTSLEGPTSVPGADDVLSRAERVYYDRAHRQLAYARHFVSARVDRVISTVEYDFLTPKSDPKARDFTPARQLLELQLSRTQREFGN